METPCLPYMLYLFSPWLLRRQGVMKSMINPCSTDGSQTDIEIKAVIYFFLEPKRSRDHLLTSGRAMTGRRAALEMVVVRHDPR